MARDPRVGFEQLLGDGGTDQQRSESRQLSASILDWVTHEVTRVKQNLGVNDRNRLDEYLDDIREVERRIQKIDLQALAFTAGMTRVSAFKMSRDVSQRVWP